MEEYGQEEQQDFQARIALLSNVNMNFVIRLLEKQTSIYRPEGYGNELGFLMDPDSAYHAFAPEITFLILDVLELTEHELEPEAAAGRMDEWFALFRKAVRETEIYYLSDAWLWGTELEAAEPSRKAALERLWNCRLEELCRSLCNVRIFPYRAVVEELGEENAFSLKTWYLGKIPHSSQAQKRLAERILSRVRVERRTAKKVLLLDLDNTLWGGLAGENDHTPILLSEDHAGLAYKNLQRVLLQLRKSGVLLGIVSKNNEADALELIEKHPHMALREADFAARRINWRPKHENIREIAEELNLGLDSFVFWDDSPSERQLVKELLPQVTVPDFPDRPEELAPAAAAIYREYFEKPVITAEDRDKTAQYAALAGRKKLEEAAGSFEDYLEQLELEAVQADPWKNKERLLQLLNKTNQFNLLTRRYTHSRLGELLEDKARRIYLYQVLDRFGDNGIVAAAVVDCEGEVPVLEDFVMSCRVMGKHIEHAIVEDIEADMRAAGYQTLRARYLPTSKNMPVAELYQSLGYQKTASWGGDGAEFEICLAQTPKRMYCVKMRKP